MQPFIFAVNVDSDGRLSTLLYDAKAGMTKIEHLVELVNWRVFIEDTRDYDVIN